jgi:hypothetical protein
MEEVLDRISVRQFISTLTPVEMLCVAAKLSGCDQSQIANIFGDSPATVCRIFKRIQSKYTAWNA